jgi:hypothetical protein
MKKSIFIIFLLALHFSLQGQCVANAGNDKISCQNDPDADSVQIGGSPSASSGIQPYSYSWYIQPIQWFPGSFKIYASDILDDTTASNPHIIDRWAEDTITFYLNVSDSIGNQCTDSCVAVFSNFTRSLAIRYFTILQGDSIYLNHGANIDGGIGNLSYLWRPNHGLRDSTLVTGFWAKPDSSIKYYVTVTDDVGCSDRGDDYYYITVNHMSINENLLNNGVKIFPNPASDILNISLKELNVRRLSVCNVLGQEVYHSDTFREQIDISSYPLGIYILTLETDKGVVRRSFIKR